MADTDVHAILSLQGWERAKDVDLYFAGWEIDEGVDPLTFCEPSKLAEVCNGKTSCEIGCQTTEEWPVFQQADRPPAATPGDAVVRKRTLRTRTPPPPHANAPSPAP